MKSQTTEELRCKHEFEFPENKIHFRLAWCIYTHIRRYSLLTLPAIAWLLVRSNISTQAGQLRDSEAVMTVANNAEESNRELRPFFIGFMAGPFTGVRYGALCGI
jgi:hypothetical protein